MITNIFHYNSEYIGFNIERIKTEFIITVAFKIHDKWKARSLSGIFGDLRDAKIFERVVIDGIDIDESDACKIFSNVGSLELEYTSTLK
ncbi:MAG: hypothetical protein ACOVNP_03900 [Flavobacterium sp.]